MTSLLERQYFGNSVETWLIALGIIVISFVVLKVLQVIVARRLATIAKTTITQLDDLVVDVIGKTKFIFVLVASLYAGTSVVVLPPALHRIIGVIFVLGLLLQVGFWGNALIGFWLNRMVKRRMAEDAASATTMSALGFLTRLILWSGVLLVGLDNVGVNITGLATGLGIGGIAVALAVQNVLGDLFASLSIVLDKPFVIGDFIIVDQYLGTVEYIGLKTTRVRSLSGEQVVFSNTDLLRSRIRNYKRMFERRVVFSIGIVYQTPAEKVEAVSAIIRKIIEQQKNARFDRAHFKTFGDSALEYEIVYYVTNSDFNVYMDIQQAINLEILRTFRREGIEFAYPTRTLFVEQSGKTPETTLTNENP